MLGGGMIFWECVALEKERPSCFSRVSVAPRPRPALHAGLVSPPRL